MLGGNFTPLREPQLTFDTLVLKDGKSFPIQTSVSPGTDMVVRFNAASAAEQKKGKIATATEAARQQIETKKRAVIAAIKGPGKMDRVKEALWSFAPWHPQCMPSASRFNAKLQTPIDFGDVSIPEPELTELGSEPAPDTIVAARLIPSLDSQTASHGTAVDAVLTRPLFPRTSTSFFRKGAICPETSCRRRPHGFGTATENWLSCLRAWNCPRHWRFPWKRPPRRSWRAGWMASK